MEALLVHLVRRGRPYRGWVPFLLVMLAVLCLPLTLNLIANKPPPAEAVLALSPVLGSLPVMTILAVLAGLVLSRTRLSGPQAMTLGGLLGSGLALVVVGRLVPPWWLWWEIFKIALNGPGSRAMDIGGSQLPGLLLAGWAWRQVQALGYRLWADTQTMARHGAFLHSEIYPLLVVLGIWAVAFFAAWQIYRRRSAILGLVPSGAVLAILLVNFPVNAFPVFLFLFCLLWLAAGCQLWACWDRWHETRTDFPDDLDKELVIAAVPAVAVLLLLGGLVPNLGPWHLSRAIWGEPAPAEGSSGKGASAGAGPAGILPRVHLLGGSPELERTTVLTIATGDPPPQPGPAEGFTDAAGTPRRYWRSETFDIYTGVGWLSSPSASRPVAAGESLQPGTSCAEELRQDVMRVAAGNDTVYAVNAPVRLDHPSEAWWRGPGDLARLTGNSDRYTVTSCVSQAGISELQAAPPDLPAELSRQYVTVPPTLPRRVADLAQQVTRQAATPYDQASAIEAFLRSYPYTLDLPDPPKDRDIVDYFLFELQRGYCDYYASAMVVMARVVGLPARLATGYAQGTYDFETGRWVVTAKDAHSWVEVYFGGIGWTEFEPTPGLPSVTRAGGETSPGIVVPPLPARQVPWWLRVRLPLLASGAVLAILSAAALYFWFRHRLKARRPCGEDYFLAGSVPLVADRYARLVRWGERLGWPLRTGQTPSEYAAHLGAALLQHGQMARPRRLRGVARQACAEVQWLTEAHVRTVYGRHPPGDIERRQVREQWRRLHRHLWLLRLARS